MSDTFMVCCALNTPMVVYALQSLKTATAPPCMISAHCAHMACKHETSGAVAPAAAVCICVGAGEAGACAAGLVAAASTGHGGGGLQSSCLSCCPSRAA
eukprot:1138556-Pelagomonas_calceolata.AAC.1